MCIYIKGIKRIYDYNLKSLSHRFKVFLGSPFQEQCFDKYIRNIWVVVKDTDLSREDRLGLYNYLEQYGLIHLIFIDSVNQLLNQNTPPLRHNYTLFLPDLLVVGFTEEEINELIEGAKKLYSKDDIEIEGPIDLENCKFFDNEKNLLKIYKADMIKVKE